MELVMSASVGNITVRPLVSIIHAERQSSYVFSGVISLLFSDCLMQFRKTHIQSFSFITSNNSSSQKRFNKI
jgi:hypothetical protein